MSEFPVQVKPKARLTDGAPRAAGGSGGQAGRLGISTKYAAQNERQISGDEAGEIVTIQTVRCKDGSAVERVKYDQDAVDLERWMMKAHARKLLMQVENRDKKTKVRYTEIAPYCDLETRRVRYAAVGERFRFEVVPGKDGKAMQKKAAVYRVINCTRSKIDNQTQPEVWHSKQSDRASFHKVQLCGSVWTCPTCSRKINLQRQRQIQHCYDLFQLSKASDVMMITFTVPHGWTDKTADTLAMLKDADRAHFQKSWTYRVTTGYWRTVKGVKVRVPSPLGYVGRISATEITYGKNGAHPHLHQLWFFDKRLTRDEVRQLRADLYAAWADACEAAGLPRPKEFTPAGKPLGVDVRRALSAAEYMAKFGDERTWGPEKEMASAHVKTSKKGKSPFQLLFDAAQGDEKAGDLFRDFAAATLGKHQLEFSHSLRRRLKELGVDDLDASDEELARVLAEDSTKLGELTDNDFIALCTFDPYTVSDDPKKRPPNPFGTLLAICKLSGFDEAIKWVRSLPTYFLPSSSG